MSAPQPFPDSRGIPDRSLQVQAEQVRLLYGNADVSSAVTVVVAAILVYLLRNDVPRQLAMYWLLYMAGISVIRLLLAAAYRRRSNSVDATGRWNTLFTIAVGLSGMGWGAAAWLLYPAAPLSQILLAFVLGGMMMGSTSLLAARQEAFLVFILPTGIPISLRFLSEGNAAHAGMAALALLYTLATMITALRTHVALEGWLTLQFDNRGLVESLRSAKLHTESLNQELEQRVQARTAELNRANQHLKAEIEQRQHAEEELLRTKKLEALAVMAGGIAHDFNNFLTVVIGNVTLAKEEVAAASDASEYLEQTLSACERAVSLSSQLLTFSKGGQPVRRVTSISKLVRDSAELAGAGTNVRIDLEIAGDLWPAEIDESQVSHALHNILLNARQAMPEGGVTLVRADNVNHDGRYVRISIQDQGCGIPPEVLPRIFDPYFTTKSSGSGLGLAAAYAIVSRHGGRIAVNSAQGDGTTVDIYLPASDQPLPARAAGSAGPRSASGRILIMDDEEALRRMISNTLTRLGYRVECAADGAEALDLYRRRKDAGAGFDAVLLDLTVPGGMGGEEAAVRLRQLDPAARLIVSSGYSDSPIMSDCVGHGVDAVIRKPWSTSDLADTIARLVGRAAG